MRRDHLLMKQAAARLRSLDQENVGLRKQAARIGRFDDSCEIVGTLVEKGIITSPGEAMQKLAELVNGDEDLAITKAATKLATSGGLDSLRVSQSATAQGISPEAGFMQRLFQGN